MTPPIDNQSPSGAWKDAIEREEKRKAVNQRIIDMNARIKAAWGNEPADVIAKREGVSESYVIQIGKRWGQ